MDKNRLHNWFILVVLGGTLLMTSCANRDLEITVSQEEIKKEVAKLEQLEKTGALKSKLQKKYGEDFKILDLPGNGLPLSEEFRAYEKAGDNYEAGLKKLRMILEKDSPELEELAEFIIRVRKAKKISDREYKKAMYKITSS